VGKTSHTPPKLEHVTGQATTRHAQLLVYGFGPGADFEGRLLGALEQIESGGTVRVLDAGRVSAGAARERRSSAPVAPVVAAVRAPVVTMLSRSACPPQNAPYQA
jgi:hypothetical protein